ncbi:hypothetical protein ACOBQJ_04870 [Pelotomaculum propionicicum]|uniref:hypothetical protein n=1 Tax=Pelotomaculum propionicicum TaxID=258475 RepID=UPI003B7EB7B3
MDQIYQLHRQIQELRNEINTISQVASQLQRAEANNAAQLQRLQQNESVATQQLNTIQQLCHHLSQDVNAISNATQQVTSQMFNRPVSSGQFGAQNFSQPMTGQYGAFTPSATSMYSPSQFGAFGAQFSPYMSAGTTSRFGQSLNIPDYAVAQQYTGMSQSMPFTSGIMPGSTMNTLRSSISPMTSASSLSVMPSYTSQQQFGTSGLASGSTYAPYVSSQISSLPSTGLLSSQTHLSTPQNQFQLSTPQNMAYSSF